MAFHNNKAATPPASMATNPILSIRRLGHAFEGRPLFKNISLDFHAATINLITGPNGSGKTTFLKIAAGLIKPDHGEAIRGQKEPPAYLGHETMFYPALSAMENLSFWLGLSQSPPELSEMRAILAEAGLGRHLHTPAGKFSRGMLQKLQIARILLQKSSLVLLDEPASGLDSQSRDFLREKALELRGKGACILMVSHDAARDAAICDNMLKLENKSLAPRPDIGNSRG